MSYFSEDYLKYVSRRYPTHSTATTLWENANGDIAEIEDQVPSIDRWTRLLRLAEGGAVRPIDLTLAALRRDPHNPLLLADLEKRLPEGLRQRAEVVVQQVLKSPEPRAVSEALTQLGNLNDTEVVAATVVATEKAEKENGGMREVVLEGIKAAAGEAAKVGIGLLALHLGLPMPGAGQ